MNPLILTALLAPASISYHGEKATFVDFSHANYQIEISSLATGSKVLSEIELNQIEDGHIIFDLKSGVDEVLLDGEKVEVESLVLPADPVSGDSSTVKVIKQNSLVGTHRLTIKSDLGKGQHISFFSGGTEVYFKMRDLRDRHFLEQYLPTNLEYDQYAMHIELRANVKNPSALELLTNSTAVTRTEPNTWIADYPAYFNCSSLFLHLFPTNKYQKINDEFVTSSGRKIPVTVYGKKKLNLTAIKNKTFATLKELDHDYGEFPHPQLLVYVQGMSGGMEYAGATESSQVSIGHELFHSYFGRGVMPANGTAGCLDEGLASWRDHGYFKTDTLQTNTSSICGHGNYTRSTDKNSYHDGRQFFAYVDQKLQAMGGLKVFLRKFLAEHVHEVISASDFRLALSDFAQSESLNLTFGKYLMGEPK